MHNAPGKLFWNASCIMHHSSFTLDVPCSGMHHTPGMHHAAGMNHLPAPKNIIHLECIMYMDTLLSEMHHAPWMCHLPAFTMAWDAHDASYN